MQDQRLPPPPLWSLMEQPLSRCLTLLLARTSESMHEIFIPYMSTKLQSSSRLDLVWDSYLADSLKSSARAKHGRGVSRRVVTDAVIPVNWQSFLHMDANKTQLFLFLSEAFIQWFDIEDKQLVITNGEEVFSKPLLLPDLASLTPCNHEEADS